ncbi:MAG: DNA-3-methyladenine glycosylase I [Candidatus Bathyarchaeota archaeon]
MPDERTPPKWVYKGRRPPSDDAYFENMSRCVFQAGLSWRLMADKWPNFQRTFDGFEVRKVAGYGADDIRRLSEDSGIIRNRSKIVATIENAREFERVAAEAGSFQRWLDGIDKANNYDLVVKRLKARFRRVGPSTAHIFLWSVGEPIEYEPEVFTRRPKKMV